MKRPPFALPLTLAMASIAASPALAQPANPAPGPAPSAPTVVYRSAADAAAVLRKGEAGGKTADLGALVGWGPFQAQEVYRADPTPFYSNDDYAEYFLIVDGQAVFNLGGVLIDPKRTGARTQAAAAQGAVAYTVGKGDMIMAPPGTPHQLTQIKGKLVYVAMHLPLPAPAPAPAPAPR